MLTAIAVQFASGTRTPGFNPVNFFGFFTILSNTFGAVLLLSAALPIPLPRRLLSQIRGAAVLCLVIVGIVFSALLARLDSEIIPWVNGVVHYFAPIAIVLDWLVDPPPCPPTMRDGIWWLAVPLGYVLVTLLRGSIVHWYPYPFLNVEAIGWTTVLLYCAGIFVFSLIVASAVVWTGKRGEKTW